MNSTKCLHYKTTTISHSKSPTITRQNLSASNATAHAAQTGQCNSNVYSYAESAGVKPKSP